MSWSSNRQDNPSSPPLDKGRLGGVWDILFPPRCLGCRQFGNWLCQNCRDKIEVIRTPICYKCRRLSPDFKICSGCRRHQPYLNRVIVYSYWQSPLKELVYGLKYHRVKPIAEVLGGWLTGIVTNFCPETNLIIVPVPLHQRRMWDRGFNQAELLAEVISQSLHQPLVKAIRRRRFTRPQFGLTKTKRLTNVAAAFAIAPRYQSLIIGRTVLLVDDIVTTGATLNECAKILKQNGAKEIWGLVLARV